MRNDKIENLKTCEGAVAIPAWVGSTVSWVHFSGDLFWRSFFSFGKLTSNMLSFIFDKLSFIFSVPSG